jgi:hypothetical protein
VLKQRIWIDTGLSELFIRCERCPRAVIVISKTGFDIGVLTGFGGLGGAGEIGRRGLGCVWLFWRFWLRGGSTLDL